MGALSISWTNVNIQGHFDQFSSSVILLDENKQKWLLQTTDRYKLKYAIFGMYVEGKAPFFVTSYFDCGL